MTFGISPGIYTREIDLSNFVTGIGTTIGAASGIFTWGPINQPMLLGSSNALVNTFGPPTNLNPETWFTASNFLDYSNSMWVCRSANTTANTANAAYNAVANTGAIANIIQNVILNNTTFQTQIFSDANVPYIAKWAGSMGNSLRVSQCDGANSYSSNVSLSGSILSGISLGNTYSGSFTIGIGSNVGIITVTQTNASNVAAGNVYATALAAAFTPGDNIYVGGFGGGPQALNVLKLSSISPAVTNATVTTMNVNFYSPSRLSQSYVANTLQRYWEFYNAVVGKPGETASVLSITGNSSLVDQLSVVVVDNKGLFTGVAGTILEVYNNLSFATDAVNPDGTTAYYRTVINNQSPYIWNVADRAGMVSNTTATIINSTNLAPISLNFSLGQDGDSELVAPLATLSTGWSMFLNKTTYPVNLIISGHPTGGTATVNGKTYNNFQLTNWLAQTIVPGRINDCVVFASPDKATVVNNSGNEAVDIVNWSTLINPSTYLVMDSGYKWQYDRYNNIYRWIPLNGDIAGLCAYTDAVSFPWFSPAGVNRGLIKNTIKLAYNPQMNDRDYFYPNGINPVISDPGYGVYLDGDRTFTLQNTSFNRINVRRLFIYLEQSIASATKPILFEINDVFTQNQFKSIVNPFLKGVKGARGIYDFVTVCDGTNNTPQVVDSNQFLGAMYVKPAKSTNYIRLDFISVPSGVSFSAIENSSF